MGQPAYMPMGVGFYNHGPLALAAPIPQSAQPQLVYEDHNYPASSHYQAPGSAFFQAQ